MNEPLVVRRETHIAAPPATVFAFLTDPEKIVSWMGAEATTEPHPGGLYLLKGVGGHARVARGAFREVVPVHRLAYTFGWEGGHEVQPGSSLIEIDLIERDGGTLLRMSRRAEEFHLRALPEPYVNLSIHTAPDVRPLP